MPVDSVRDGAVDVLLRVFERGAFLDVALDKTLRRRRLTERGKRFLTQLAYGTVRHKLLCDCVLAGRVRQPLDKLPRPIHAILRMGVFQALFCNQVTFPAMVHTSVELAKKHGHAGTARLVNAVLKRTPQRIEDVALPDPETDLPAHLEVRYSVPAWLVETWIARHGPEQARTLCRASAEQAPTALRVNTLRTNADALIAALDKAGCAAAQRPDVPNALTVLSGKSPLRTKLLHQGHFFIQDPASMLAAPLLEPHPGERILDLCAGVGGKATHLAELASDNALVVALDQQASRLHRLRDNTERLGVSNAYPLRADGTHPPFGPFFDRVLVDAPCSGWGTFRRHPDLKWRVKPDDAPRLAKTQRALLRSAVQLCKNLGVIVYSVCTFAQEETLDVAASFLKDQTATPEDGPQWLDKWKTGPGQYTVLPDDDGLDGFFLMRLRKRS